MKRTFVVAVAILLLGLALVHAEDGKPEEKKNPPAASPSPANPSKPAEKPPPSSTEKPPPSKPAAKPPASKPKSLGLRKTVTAILHKPEVHAAKSIMVMADVALVIAGIQLQLSMIHEKLTTLKLGELSASAQHHSHQAHVHHHNEHLCAQGSTAILALLLGHSLVEVWAMGSKFFKNTTLVVDLVIVATSLYLELIFDNLQGNMRLAGELWRYVRIIHGSFETFVHSPLVAPYVAAAHDPGHH